MASRAMHKGRRARVLVCRWRRNSSSLPMLPAFTLAVARTAACQASDAAKVAGNTVSGLQAPEAPAVHPPPEGGDMVSNTLVGRRGHLAP
jgi:hypothetical protein